MDPLFKEVGIYAALGQRYEPVDSELRAVVPRGDRRPGPRGGHHRGRLDGVSFQAAGTSYATHGLADDPVLHLLLDVRLPADRRPDLGVRRRARPRLPAGRHGRPHDAHRRGPAARRRPHATSSPRRSRTSAPTTRPSPTSWRRSSATASSGCTARSPRTSSTTSRSTTRTTPQPAAARGLTDEGILRGLYRFAAAPDVGRRRAPGAARRLRLDPPAGRSPRATSWPRSSASPPRSTARRRSSCCAATRSRPSAGTGSTPTPGRRACRTSARSSAADGGPIVAATDWMKALPDMVARWLAGRTTCRSAPTASAGATRARPCARCSRSTPPHIAYAALHGLCLDGASTPDELKRAIAELGIDPERVNPLHA